MQKRIIVSIIAVVIILTSLASCADKDMLNKQKDSAAGSETVTQNNNTGHDSSSDPTATEPSTDAMTDTDSNTEITSDEVTEPVTSLEAAIKTVKDEVDSKGWVDIEVIEGDPDSIKRWGQIVIEPHVISEGEVLYTVIGRSENQLNTNPFYVVVVVVYNERSNEWRKEEVYYISKAGRRMWGTYIQDYYPEEYETKEIVAADNEVLYQYMYGY